MTTSRVAPIPEGMHALTPHLVCAGAAAAIEFYKRAFNAVEIHRMPGEDGKLMHAAIRIGDSVLMLVDEAPAWGLLGPLARQGTSVILHHYVADADAAMAQAVAAGATVTMPLADMFWGDRYGQLRDPYGHCWSLATHQRDMTAEEMMAARPQGGC